MYPEGSDYLVEYVRQHKLSEYLELIKDTKKVCPIPVIASINCYQDAEWVGFAQQMEAAGADAIEINILALQTDMQYNYGSFEQRHIDILRRIKQTVNIPVIMKLGDNLTNPIALIDQLYANGAAAVVLFNRFYQPDIDIEKMKQISGNVFSTGADLVKALRWIGIASAAVNKLDYAASGGYYISCAADSIFADPTTLTGSIGIFGMIPSGEKLFKDKLGLDFDVVKTNKMADMGAGFGPLATRPFNNAEQEALQNYINNGYKLFVNRCAEGRNMSAADIEKIAEGRVWTGEMAVGLGLVDKLGGIDDALAAAAKRANVENYTIISYPEKESLFMNLLNSQRKHYVNSQMKEYMGSFYSYFEILQNLKEINPVQARMPFELNIK